MEPAPAPLPEGFRDDAELLAALRSGLDSAYDAVVRTYGGRLMAVARRLLRSDEEAQDALQEAFLAAFRALHSFEGQARLSTWLHRITVNACLMRLRSRKRKGEEPIDDLLLRYDETGHHLLPPSSWSESSDLVLDRDETRAYVRACIDRLPDTYRTVLLMRDIDELDTEETARLLGITANAVKVRLHRARQALRQLLDRRFGGSKPC